MMNFFGLEKKCNINEKKCKELKNKIINYEIEIDELYKVFNTIEIQYICYLSDWLNTQIIPIAADNMIVYYKIVSDMLILSAWNRIVPEIKISEAYILRDKQTKKYMTKKEYIYVVYTNKYEKNDNYMYEKICDSSEIIRIIKEINAKGMVLTDGPNYMCVIDFQILSSLLLGINDEKVLQMILTDEEEEKLLSEKAVISGEMYRAEDVAPIINTVKSVNKILAKDFSPEKKKIFIEKEGSCNNIRVLRCTVQTNKANIIYPAIKDLYVKGKSDIPHIPCLKLNQVKILEGAIYNIENGHEESMIAYKNKEDDVFKLP